MLPSVILPSIFISAIAVVCTLLMIAGFRIGLGRAGASASGVREATAALLITAALWFVFVGVAAHYGFFSNFAARPPRLLFALGLPAVALLVACLVSRSLAEALSETPIAWLIYLQAFRIFVELILWRGYRLGVLPVQMTFEGRNFDILVGLSAPLMGWLWTRTHKRYVALAWNFIGLVLLLNIVLVAVLSLPTGSQVFANGPAATLLTRFPFIYLPAVLVPVAYTAHVLSLRQLFRGNAG